MTWEDRPYAHEAYPESGGGLRSWFGGLPSPGRAVKGIMLANVAMFLLCLMTGGANGVIYRSLEMNTINVIHGQIWRLFTFTYLHSQSDITHLLFNMIGLYFLGLPLERHWGARRFFTFYTLGGFVAVSMYLFVTLVGWLDPRIALVGASGGVLAVLGACAALFPSMRLILILFPVPIRAAAVLFGVLFLFNLAVQGANAGGDACHLAGLAFGIAWGYRGHHWTRGWHTWRQRSRQRTFVHQRRQEAELEQSVDDILDKVHREGIQSLTRREKQILEEASRRQRTPR